MMITFGTDGGLDPWTVQYRLKRNRFSFDFDSVKSKVIAKCPGVYAIWVPTFAVDQFRCVYVGMSAVDVRNRLLHHLRDAHNDELHRALRKYDGIATFSFEYAADGREAKSIETEMIRQLKPECNILENR